MEFIKKMKLKKIAKTQGINEGFVVNNNVIGYIKNNKIKAQYKLQDKTNTVHINKQEGNLAIITTRDRYGSYIMQTAYIARFENDKIEIKGHSTRDPDKETLDAVIENNKVKINYF
jgi:hypothetical protein